MEHNHYFYDSHRITITSKKRRLSVCAFVCLHCVLSIGESCCYYTIVIVVVDTFSRIITTTTTTQFFQFETLEKYTSIIYA